MSVEDAPAVPILGGLPALPVVFPATVIGETRSAVLSLVNAGVGELSGSISYSDGFTGPTTFATETTTDITISYAPTASGIHSGTITIYSNGGDGSVSVSGNAGGSVATLSLIHI